MKNEKNISMHEGKVGIIRGILARIWRKKYAKKADERRVMKAECYRELMAERDSRTLVIPEAL